MGFMDLFRRKKTPLLGEGKTIDKKENQEQQEESKIDVKIFSRKVGDNIEYSIMLISGEESVPIGKLYNEVDSNQKVDLKKIANEIKGAIQPITDAKNQYSRDRSKNEAKEILQKVADREKMSLTSDVMHYINQYGIQPIQLDDGQPESRKKYQEVIKRLAELENIKTADDAYAQKESLEEYMMKTEKVSLNPILEASIKGLKEGKKLDDDTVKRIAQNMEKLKNEDGLLLGTYYELKQKEIWKYFKERVAQYGKTLEDKNMKSEFQSLVEEMAQVDKYYLPDVKDGFSPSILEYMINEIRERNIENYIENVKEKDSSIARRISKFKEMPERTAMMEFLYARVGSFGQVSYKSTLKGNEVLRNYVANTDLKDKNNTESKEFLLLVADIERDYLLNEYETMKKSNEKITNGTKSFKDKINSSFTPKTSEVIVLNQNNNEQHKDDGERIA